MQLRRPQRRFAEGEGVPFERQHFHRHSCEQPLRELLLRDVAPRARRHARTGQLLPHGFQLVHE